MPVRRLPPLVLGLSLGLSLALTSASARASGPEEGPAGLVEGPSEAPSVEGPQGEGAQESLLRAEDPVRALFEMPPSSRDDAYGPRPTGVPTITREQIVRYGMDNPYVRAADEHVDAMEAQLRKANFAWVPIVRTSAVIAPGAAIDCDDVTLDGADGPFSFQYCRAAGDPADGTDPVDLQTVQGYFERIGNAGIALSLKAEFVVPITTFGKIVTVQKLAKVGVELAELQRLATQQETTLRIYQAHAALMLARETIAILDRAWDIIAGERGKIAAELGLGPDGLPAFDADPDSINPDRDPDDFVRLELGEVELATRMREARAIEAEALSTLWAIAGNAAPRGFDVKERRLVPDRIPGGLAELEHYQSMALAHRPEARMADAGVKFRQTQEKLARTNFLPDLGAVVRAELRYANKATTEMRTLYYTGRLNTSSIYLGLALSWNLDFHNDAFDLQKAQAERREAEYQREAARRLLLLEVEQAYRDVLDAEQQMAFMTLARDKSWKLVVSEQAADSVGTANFNDLRKALEKWAGFEFALFEAIMNRNAAIAGLSRAVGAPLVEPAPANPSPAVDG